MSPATFQIASQPTKAYDDQKPGTSGLRKRVKTFQQKYYTHNFIQATLEAMPSPGAKGSTLVVGGDGRYYGKEAIQIIIDIAAGNGVSKLIIGQEGILSTPAVSHLIRKHKADGGILLTASHNPGGPDKDFGIKFNVSNGGPAPEAITNKIFSIASSLTTLSLASLPKVDLSKLGSQEFQGPSGSTLNVTVIDSVESYVQLMRQVFDFDQIRRFLQRRSDFTLLFDALHGVTGPYGRRLFIQELGLPDSSVQHCIPKPDFGGGHPDPNLTYAHELVERVEAESIHFGAASDGDGDRNMIIGKGVFVNPSDSVAVLAAQAKRIPYFKKHGISGVARSMPTSQALDRVAKRLGIPHYEVPTGWKFFGNLMDSGKLSICGEESFGTGSDHIREKDGLWAILAWLNILASLDEETPGTTLDTILQDHYATYGRNYFTRYDYEEVDGDRAGEMMERLRRWCSSGELVGKEMGSGFTLAQADDFSYTDPVDGSVAKKQGIRLIFQDGSRVIVRLSGTGSQGATVRLYVERYEEDSSKVKTPASEALKDLVEAAQAFVGIVEYTGRKEPTVIT
ncbi:hypothetical protein BJ684DRAFT_18964 [Piptocephalis cylindrospora]|uniref:phosphoglucomutase (alpha-D-glucose-1,6-bisphosphate-dependent) n=1 Tax=Piptocephalis cylindrospora TaxID=1907219 RepID=A0A4P9Y6C6_9FUNG|nr:hypothetical protein BJ684DRAFT_18964 [Piptocephalis cylindrospora]|eukprot:RKP14636.1 hypothetical protein BJ684DRAFT_18964 [Piptocephalis cylindrospora]